jgi:hypothetical protein
MRKITLLWCVIFAIAFVGSAVANNAGISNVQNNITAAAKAKPAPTGEQPIPDPGVILQGGDDFANATVISAMPYVDNGTTVGYTNYYDAVCPYTGSTAPDVVYSYTPTMDTLYDLTLCIDITDYDSKLYIFEDDTVGGFYACNDDDCDSPYYSSYVSALYDIWMYAGHTYYIVVDGYGANEGNYQLNIDIVVPCTPIPPNDECVDAISVTSPYPVNVTGTTICATIDCPGVLDWNAVWYEVELPYDNNHMDVDYCCTDFDIQTVGIVVYNDCNDCNAYIVATSYSFVDCNNGTHNPQMFWDNLPGPGTVLLPVYIATEADFCLDIDVYEQPLPDSLFCEPDTLLYSQVAMGPDGSWAANTSAEVPGYKVFDNYNINGTITYVKFWGLDLYFTGSWNDCSIDPAYFNIGFYPDDGSGYPDIANPTVEWSAIPVTRYETNLAYSGYYLNEYTLALPAGVSLSNGWWSAQSVNDDSCWFLWMNADETHDNAAWQWNNGSWTALTVDCGFCLYGHIEEDCLLCDIDMISNVVPNVGGVLLWDLTVTNCGSNAQTVNARMYPTLNGCGGTQFNFNLDRLVVAGLASGASYTGHYYYNVPNVPGITGVHAITIKAGPSIGSWLAECCAEFTFVGAWGATGSNTNWGGGEWLDRDTDILPTANVLGQNYPNPFNAQTSIPFETVTSNNVSLRVYNLAGQLVETLVDGQMEAGSHVANWDASTVSSGVYFYKLQIGDQVITKKMNLVK